MPHSAVFFDLGGTLFRFGERGEFELTLGEMVRHQIPELVRRVDAG